MTPNNYSATLQSPKENMQEPAIKKELRVLSLWSKLGDLDLTPAL